MSSRFSYEAFARKPIRKVTMTSIHDALGRLWDADDDARMVQSDGRWATWGSVRSLTEQIDR
jgi:long-chain acyl-CoA synthetase